MRACANSFGFVAWNCLDIDGFCAIGKPAVALGQIVASAPTSELFRGSEDLQAVAAWWYRFVVPDADKVVNRPNGRRSFKWAEFCRLTALPWGDGCRRYVPELDRRLRSHLKPANEPNKSWRVDETYLRAKGRTVNLYRAVDSAGASVGFRLAQTVRQLHFVAQSVPDSNLMQARHRVLREPPLENLQHRPELCPHTGSTASVPGCCFSYPEINRIRLPPRRAR
jgi:hypothetical protein